MSGVDVDAVIVMVQCLKLTCAIDNYGTWFRLAERASIDQICKGPEQATVTGYWGIPRHDFFQT